MSEFLTASAQRRVLIVDDDRLVREMFTAALIRHDIQSLCAGDLAEAQLALSRSEAAGTPASLLICDQNLPDGCGFDLCATFRQQDWPGKILLLSASVDLSMLREARLAGVHRVLPKATPLADLLTVCMQLLESHFQQDQTALGGTAPCALVKRFLTNLEKRRTKLEDLCPARDRALIRSLAHQLSGTAALYGFPELCNAAERCEIAAIAGSDPENLIAARIALIEELESTGRQR
jgi:DNA-binding response OmpR family regulator